MGKNFIRNYFILAASVISIGLLGACMQEEKAVDKSKRQIFPTYYL
ncbi:hypothetical protein [Peribacillus sp. TH24]|nr:hypothetical protein [Peribacillus sp. TH24]MBK5443691.1 hypothetical protein [Peribacillus sp. TH24]